MSGFEVAGIVLAVLPLFVEIGRALDKVPRDQELKEFYEEFWWQTYELRKRIETVVKRLPGRTPTSTRLLFPLAFSPYLFSLLARICF